MTETTLLFQLKASCLSRTAAGISSAFVSRPNVLDCNPVSLTRADLIFTESSPSVPVSDRHNSADNGRYFSIIVRVLLTSLPCLESRSLKEMLSHCSRGLIELNLVARYGQVAGANRIIFSSHCVGSSLITAVCNCGNVVTGLDVLIKSCQIHTSIDNGQDVKSSKSKIIKLACFARTGINSISITLLMAMKVFFFYLEWLYSLTFLNRTVKEDRKAFFLDCHMDDTNVDTFRIDVKIKIQDFKIQCSKDFNEKMLWWINM
jgi:hypothetical protein